MHYWFLILSILFIIVIIIILNKINNERYRQVPLNYFTLNEPPYFFYDPDVSFDETSFDKTSFDEYPDRHNHYDHKQRLEDSTLFGENNYLRYYPEHQQNDLNFNQSLKGEQDY